MSNKITWKFEGLASTFTTDAEKFDATVNQLRQRNYLSYNHPVEILNDGNTESNPESVASESSISDAPATKTVRKRAKSSKSVEETTELQSVPTSVDDADLESDAL